MENRNKSKGKSIAVGTLIYAIGNLGTKIISFLIVPLYTYYISTEEMGDFDLVLTTVRLLAPLITLRVSDASYRWMLHKVEPNEKCISNTYYVMLLTSIISGACLALIHIVHPIQYFIYFLTILILGRWQETLQFLLRGLGNQKLFAISGVVYSLVYVSLNLLQIVILHQGVEALFQSTILSEIIVIILLILMEPRLRAKSVVRNKDTTFIKAMLKYSMPLIPSGLCWWVMGASDRYVIRLFLGRSATGIFAIANRFPTIVTTLFTIFNYSWTDVAIGSLEEGKETSEYSSNLFEKMYVLSFSFVLFLIPATKILSNVILSESYRSGAIYIAFLYLGSLFQGFTAFISAGMLQQNDTKRIASSSTIGAVVNLLFDIIAMKFIGLHAASISTFLGGLVMWICRMRDSSNISPIHIDRKRFAVLLITSVALSIVSIWTTLQFDAAFALLFGVLFIIINRNTLYNLMTIMLKRRK